MVSGRDHWGFRGAAIALLPPLRCLCVGAGGMVASNMSAWTLLTCSSLLELLTALPEGVSCKS